MIARIKTVPIASVLAITLTLFAGAFAQTQPTTQDMQLQRAQLEELRALSEEVRQLRAVMQRTNISTYRAQRLAEQLAQQQSHVAGLVEQIEQLKAQVQQALDTSHDEEELRDLESAIRVADPQARSQLAQVYESLKRSIERQRDYSRQETERNRARQQQLEGSLQVEQARLAEMREQMDALDRDFDRQLGDGKKIK